MIAVLIAAQGCGRLGFQAEQPDGAAADRWCAQQTPVPTFCDDFDDGAAVDAPWDGTHIIVPGSSLQPDSLATSPPTSLRAFMAPPLGNCMTGGAFAWRAIAGNAWHFQYDIRLGDAAGAGFVYAAISSAQFTTGVITCKFFLVTDGTTATPNTILQLQRFAPAYTQVDTPLAISPVPGTWSTVETYVSADVNGDALVRVVVDGAEALAPAPFAQCPLSSPATFWLGVYGCNYANEARYDNAKVDAM
jgi:hypothetical protein